MVSVRPVNIVNLGLHVFDKNLNIFDFKLRKFHRVRATRDVGRSDLSESTVDISLDTNLVHMKKYLLYMIDIRLEMT